MTAESQRASCDIYRAAVEETYMAGYLEAAEREREKRKARKEKRERKKYFLTQKLYGIATLAMTAVIVKLLDGDATVALLTVPLGIMLLTSKEMLIVNKYYWKHEDEAERQWEKWNL